MQDARRKEKTINFWGNEAVRAMRKPAVISMAYLGTAFASAHADWALNMRQGVTETSQSVYDLHMIIFWVCCAIGVPQSGHATSPRRATSSRK